jgi:hypothetical protein
MSMFDDIKLGWQGQNYVIPAHRGLEAMARVEEAMTLHELQQFHMRRTLPVAKLANAYASLLGCAGKIITGEEVYATLKGSGVQEGEMMGFMAQVLLGVLLPQSLTKQVAATNQGQVLAVGETPAGNCQAAPGTASSKAGSSSWSDRDGSQPRPSGPGRRWKSSGSSKRRRRSR